MAAPIDYTPVRNTTDEVIPSGGLFRVTGIDADTGAFLVDLPDADDDGAVGVNGLGLIPAGAAGQGHFDPRAIAAYDAADGTPQPGEAWGVKAGDWRLRKGYAGFRVLAGVGLGLANVVRAGGGGGGGGGTGCAKFAGLRRDECVTFTVPAGSGVDPVTLSGAYSSAAGGWVSAGTVSTSDGATRLVLFNKAEGGKGLRLVGETRTWYGDDLGCLGTDREFAAAVTPPELENDNSASGGAAGCCAGCDDHTFRVRVGCRPAGTAGLPEQIPTCAWRRTFEGTWAGGLAQYTAGGAWALRNPFDGTATLSTGAGYSGWYIDCSTFPELCDGPHMFYAWQVWYDPAACNGLGGFVWNYLYAVGGDIYASEVAATLSSPAPADDPWELVVFDGLVIRGDGTVDGCEGGGPPDETRYACVDGVCVPTPGGPYTSPTCGGTCDPPPGGECCEIADEAAVRLVITGGANAGTYDSTWDAAATAAVFAGAVGGTAAVVECATVFGRYQANGILSNDPNDCGPPVTATWAGALAENVGGPGTTSVVFTTL